MSELPDQTAHLTHAQAIVDARFRAMTPTEKLRVATRLYYSARELKAAWLRSMHPNLLEPEIQSLVREAFLYART